METVQRRKKIEVKYQNSGRKAAFCEAKMKKKGEDT